MHMPELQFPKEAKGTKVTRVRVNSSNIKEIGWNEGVLEVQFYSKEAVWRYYPVSESLFTDLMKDKSQGSFFATKIKFKKEILQYQVS